MSSVVSAVEGAIGIVLALGVIAGFLWILGTLAFAGRRRAFSRGTHPLRLLPWYLGGPPNAQIEDPPEGTSGRPHPRRR